MKVCALCFLFQLILNDNPNLFNHILNLPDKFDIAEEIDKE
jgi:hypothetical protein